MINPKVLEDIAKLIREANEKIAAAKRLATENGIDIGIGHQEFDWDPSYCSIDEELTDTQDEWSSSSCF